MRQRIRKKGRMERTAGKKKPLRTQGGGAESGTQNQGSGKTAAGLHTAPDRNAVCRNTATRQNPPVGAAARPNRRRPGDGAAGRSSGFGVRPLTAAAPRGNHTRLPYSPCGGQTAAGHLALVCGTEALRLKRPYNKPIKKQKASANAFSSVRQNPSLVNENRSALLGIQIEKIPAAAAEF